LVAHQDRGLFGLPVFSRLKPKCQEKGGLKMGWHCIRLSEKTYKELKKVKEKYGTTYENAIRILLNIPLVPIFERKQKNEEELEETQVS